MGGSPFAPGAGGNLATDNVLLSGTNTTTTLTAPDTISSLLIVGDGNSITGNALTVARVVILGSSVYRPEEFDPLYAEFVGRQVTLATVYEIAARVTEQAFDYLDAPVLRVTGKDVPMPYAANLEKLALPSVAEIVDAVKVVCYR